MNKTYVINLNLLLFLSMSSCLNTENKVGKEQVIDVQLIDFGKSKQYDSSFFEITKISKKDITSAFHVKFEDEKVKSLPVNDSLFNYDYFNKKIYPNIEGRRVRLTVKKYIINNKEIFVVNRIH